MDDDDEEEWEDVEGEAITSTECLFCDRSSADAEKNVEHMTKGHSFFIPNIEFLVDLQGLLNYLGKLEMLQTSGDFFLIYANKT